MEELDKRKSLEARFSCLIKLTGSNFLGRVMGVLVWEHQISAAVKQMDLWMHALKPMFSVSLLLFYHEDSSA